MAVLLYPRLVAQPLHGGGVRGAHVVAQAQGVAHLVRRDKADELPHQAVVELHPLCALVERAALHHVPFRQQRHHVVVPADVRLDDFAASRVNDARAVGVLGLGGQIAQHGEAGVVDRHVRTILGPLLGHDGVLEASGLESHLPVVDALYQVGHPLLGRGRVYVVHYLLFRLGQLAAQVLLLVFRHEAVARDERLVAAFVLVIGELREAIDEVAYALVPEALAHGRLGQQHDRGVEAQGDRAGLRRSRRGGAAAVGAGSGYLDVGGKHLQGVYECAVAAEAAHFQGALVGAVQAQYVVVLLEERGHVNQLRRLVFGAPNDLERHHHRVDGRLLQCRGYLVAVGRQLAKHVLAHEQCGRIALLEVDGAVGHLLAGKLAEVLRHRREAGHAEQQSA